MKLSACLLALALAVPALAVAEDSPPVGLDPAGFAAQKAEILKDFEDGKRYSELTATQRREVVDSLESIERALAGVSAVRDLDEEVKAELINEQEKINTLLTQAAEDSRLVCKRERRVGSHRTTTTCRTVGEMKRERERTRQELDLKNRGDRLPDRG